jgi:hypothetical protein
VLAPSVGILGLALTRAMPRRSGGRGRRPLGGRRPVAVPGLNRGCGETARLYGRGSAPGDRRRFPQRRGRTTDWGPLAAGRPSGPVGEPPGGHPLRPGRRRSGLPGPDGVEPDVSGPEGRIGLRPVRQAGDPGAQARRGGRLSSLAGRIRRKSRAGR